MSNNNEGSGLRERLIAAFDAGFEISAEGWNGEYGANTDGRYYREKRDAAIEALSAVAYPPVLEGVDSVACAEYLEGMARDQDPPLDALDTDYLRRSANLLRAASPAAPAQQAWRCTRRFEDDGGIVKEIKYAKTEQDMLILQDQGFTCTALTSAADLTENDKLMLNMKGWPQ